MAYVRAFPGVPASCTTRRCSVATFGMTRESASSTTPRWGAGASIGSPVSRSAQLQLSPVGFLKNTELFDTHEITSLHDVHNLVLSGAYVC
jgi:hypothetical protein